MRNRMNPWKRQTIALTAVLFSVVLISGQADGQPAADQSILSNPGVLVVQEETLPIPPQSSASPNQSAQDGPDCACGPVCVYNPCIKYRGEHRLKRFCCGCKCPTFEKILLTIEDPARCGCAVEIPICVPTCCQGKPCVKSRCGVLGRGVVWLKWCCGYKVRVLFAGNNDCKGRNVIVSYFGK